MENDWTQWTPPQPHLPALDPETLAAVRELQGGEVGRRFAVARQVEDLVRLAIVQIDNGRPDETGRDAARRDRQIHHRVVEGRSLLRTYLGQN